MGAFSFVVIGLAWFGGAVFVAQNIRSDIQLIMLAVCLGFGTLSFAAALILARIDALMTRPAPRGVRLDPLP